MVMAGQGRRNARKKQNLSVNWKSPAYNFMEGHQNTMKICLLGASFGTGNLGVSALAESSIKVVLNRWPEADVVLAGSGFTPQQYRLTISGREMCLRTIPIRFSKNILLPYHFVWFVLYGLLAKILPNSRLRQALIGRNFYFSALYDTSFAVDITGGDSFSDIYGLRRFFLGFLCKWLVMFLGKKFILLPQTYGPFKGRLSRIMARYILSRAEVVYSRDQDGLDCVAGIFAGSNKVVKVKLVPDVAFVLDSHQPKHVAVNDISASHARGNVLVGFNISALLYNGGYTGSNMFGLKASYRDLVCAVIQLLMKRENVVVLMVPHVFPPPGWEVESDVMVNSLVYESIQEADKGRVMNVITECDQGEIKYIIGQCDFFIGSRMHSCIAALSQCVPAVGIAYSKKFAGVFGSTGMSDCVADARYCDESEVLEKIESVFDRRAAVRQHLEMVVPRVQEQVLGIFRDLNSS
jgi:colanic acid/amylovoran biosynthesis protein